MSRRQLLSLNSRVRNQQPETGLFSEWQEQEFESDSAASSAEDSDEDDKIQSSKDPSCHNNEVAVPSQRPSPTLEISTVIVQDEQVDDDGTLSLWKNRKSKQRIVSELKKGREYLPIFIWIGEYSEKDWTKVNFKKIQEVYAQKRYNTSRFRENLKRLLKKLLKKEGEFAPEKIEPWYTSSKKVSKGYRLLYLLHIDPKKFRTINAMTAEELWKSHPQFQLYELGKFKSTMRK